MMRNIIVLAFVNLLLVDNTSGATIDDSDSQNNKHVKIIPKRVKELEQKASSQDELTGNVITQLDEHCLSLETWKDRNQQAENLYNPRPDHETGVLKILSVRQSSTFDRDDAHNATDLKTGTNWARSECSHTDGGQPMVESKARILLYCRRCCAD